MSVKNAQRVATETNKKYQFSKLPNGLLIDPENSEFIITQEMGIGGYIVRPVFDEDGRSNCKFIFAAGEAG